MTCHRKFYILSHGILRLLLSRYTGDIPKSISIYTNEYGKPFIKSNSIKFNMSHSRSKLVITIALVELGADIEYINPKLDFIQIMYSVLTKNEKQYVKGLELNLQREQFYKYWTEKEAFLFDNEHEKTIRDTVRSHGLKFNRFIQEWYGNIISMSCKIISQTYRTI